MEILNSYNQKRTILLVDDGAHDLSALKAILEPHYRLAQNTPKA